MPRGCTVGEDCRRQIFRLHPSAASLHLPWDPVSGPVHTGQRTAANCVCVGPGLCSPMCPWRAAAHRWWWEWTFQLAWLERDRPSMLMAAARSIRDLVGLSIPILIARLSRTASALVASVSACCGKAAACLAAAPACQAAALLLPS